jgi:hypothetical protein
LSSRLCHVSNSILGFPLNDEFRLEFWHSLPPPLEPWGCASKLTATSLPPSFTEDSDQIYPFPLPLTGTEHIQTPMWSCTLRCCIPKMGEILRNS